MDSTTFNKLKNLLKKYEDKFTNQKNSPTEYDL